MSNDKKSDLSDLKARLGLKKPSSSNAVGRSEEKQESAKVSQSGAQATIPRPDRPQAPSGQSGASPSGQKANQSPQLQGAGPSDGGLSTGNPTPVASAPPRRSGPPPGAMGPPPTARAPVAPQLPSTSVSAGPSAEVDEKVDLKDLGFKEDVGLGLSAPIIVLLVILLVVGLFFGFMASQSFQTRNVEIARINDATKVLEYLEPRFDALTQAHSIIAGLDEIEPDFEAAEELSELDFLVAGDILPNNRMLLGREIISPLNRYMVEASILYERTQLHHRVLNREDREELEALLEENEELLDIENLAIVFDFRHLVVQGREADYEPLTGRLVSVDSWETDEEGLVTIQMLSRNTTDKVEIQALIPVSKEDLLRAEGDNAAERNARRVADLKERAEALTRRVEPLREALSSVADQDPPAWLSFSASGGVEEYDEAAAPGDSTAGAEEAQ